MNWVLLAPTMSEFSGSTLVSEARVLWSDSFKDEFVQDIVDLISLSIDHEFGSVDGLGCLVAGVSKVMQPLSVSLDLELVVFVSIFSSQCLEHVVHGVTDEVMVLLQGVMEPVGETVHREFHLICFLVDGAEANGSDCFMIKYFFGVHVSEKSW